MGARGGETGIGTFSFNLIHTDQLLGADCAKTGLQALWEQCRSTNDPSVHYYTLEKRYNFLAKQPHEVSSIHSKLSLLFRSKTHSCLTRAAALD
jgi:hypothetical protein